MVLLTVSMAFGLLSSVGYQRPGLPRFATVGLHRNASLLALAFTAAHVITTVIDSYVHIPIQDAFIPSIPRPTARCGWASAPWPPTCSWP